MKKLLLIIGALLLVPMAALAQSSPGLVFGQVPTAGQWNSYFSAKQDYLGTLGSGVLVRAVGATLTNTTLVNPAFTTPNLGTPSAINLINGTNLPVSTGIAGLGTGVATFLGTPSSANLLAALTNKTGTGLSVFATSPTLTTPTLGDAGLSSINAQVFYVQSPHNFVADDAAAINAAIAAAVATGGGTVTLGPFAYWANSADIYVPQNVRLVCDGYSGTLVAGLNYQNTPCSIYFASGFGLVLQHGEVDHVNVFADAIHFTAKPSTRAQIAAYVDAFAGTGISIGDGTNDSSADGSIFREGLIGGFAQCIDINWAAQVKLENVLGDCTNGLEVGNSHDDNRLKWIQWWEFLTTASGAVNQNWTISNLADDGSGHWEATLATASDISTTVPENLWVSQGTGAEGSRGYWPVEAIDSTHVVLQGSATAPTTTGTVTAATGYISVSSIANLQPGMVVAEATPNAHFPVGATIGGVWRGPTPAISLANCSAASTAGCATASATGLTLTFSSSTYTASSASLSFDGNYRNGIGFQHSSSPGTAADGQTCDGCFAFDYTTGFNFNNATGLSYVNTQYDSPNHRSNQNVRIVGVDFSGNQDYANFISSSVLTADIAVLSESTTTAGSYANTVEGARPAGSSNVLEVDSGSMILRGFQDGATHEVLLNGSAEIPVLSDNQLANTNVYGTAVFPAWIGASRFVGINSNLGAAQGSTLTLTGGFRAGSTLLFSSGPNVSMLNSSAPSGQRGWYLGPSSVGTLFLGTLTDAGAAVNNAMNCTQGASGALGKCTWAIPMVFATPAQDPVYTVSALLALSSPVAGQHASVSDAMNCTPGSSPIGGGSTYCTESFNGSAWIH